MNKWIYKQTITTPTGSHLAEIECPQCRYRQTVPEYIRPSSCYVCESKIDPDDFFWLEESIELKSEAAV